jgi:multidrug efflux pump subunit AcrB
MENTPQSPSFDLNAFNAQHPSADSPIALKSLTGPGGADLSLSELSIEDISAIQQQPQKPFSLFASSTTSRQASTSAVNHERQMSQTENGDKAYSEEEQHEVAASDEQQAEGTARQSARQSTTQSREEKLQSDLFVLRKLNTAFSQYIDAMKETKDLTEVRVLLLTCHRLFYNFQF